jgi:hypothetical protein
MHPTVLHLANLPLKGVTSLEYSEAYWGATPRLGTLQLPLYSRQVEDMPRLLHQAATNLAACPAWKAEPQGTISLEGDPTDTHPSAHNTVYFPDHQCIQLLQSLAPLGGPHVRVFKGNIWGAQFRWGRAEVQALAGSLRSDRVTRLALDHCFLAGDFCAALDESLPALKTLQLGKDVTYGYLDIGRRFVIFCTRWI